MYYFIWVCTTCSDEKSSNHENEGKISATNTGLDALDEELDYDESMEDIEQYLREDFEEDLPKDGMYTCTCTCTCM